MISQHKMRSTINKQNIDFINSIIWWNIQQLTWEKHSLE
jgi:hypothetical protein